MASVKIKLRLVSTAGTGYFKTTTRNPRTTEKLRLRKYDPVVRKYVIFEEAKIK